MTKSKHFWVVVVANLETLILEWKPRLKWWSQNFEVMVVVGGGDLETPIPEAQLKITKSKAVRVMVVAVGGGKQACNNTSESD